MGGPEDSLLADLDGDGDLDALSVSSTDESIAAYENVWDGELASQVILAQEDHLTAALRAGDLEMDR